MIINDEENWLYIETPKCASRTMVKILPDDFGGVKVGTGHDNRVNQIVDQEDYYIWTIVRSPYSRMLSLWWKTCVQTGDRDDPYTI